MAACCPLSITDQQTQFPDPRVGSIRTWLGKKSWIMGPVEGSHPGLRHYSPGTGLEAGINSYWLFALLTFMTDSAFPRNSDVCLNLVIIAPKTTIQLYHHWEYFSNFCQDCDTVLRNIHHSREHSLPETWGHVHPCHISLNETGIVGW